MLPLFIQDNTINEAAIGEQAKWISVTLSPPVPTYPCTLYPDRGEEGRRGGGPVPTYPCTLYPDCGEEGAALS